MKEGVYSIVFAIRIASGFKGKSMEHQGSKGNQGSKEYQRKHNAHQDSKEINGTSGFKGKSTEHQDLKEYQRKHN